MFEIERYNTSLEKFTKHNIIYSDFLSEKINTLYETIIGNPPYVKTKKGNLY